MLLTDIRDYIQLHGQVSLSQLARRFDVPESAMEGMLNIWISKGKIELLQAQSAPCGSQGGCGGCQSYCSDGSKSKRYRWRSEALR